MNTFIKQILIIGFMVTALIAQTPQEAVYFLHDESGVGIKAQSMGNAFVGVANDYSAIYWNPAGLAQLETSEIDGSIYHLKYNNAATYVGSTIFDDRSFTKLHSLGLAYKFPTDRGSFVIAFGYNRFKNYDEYLYFSGFSQDSIDLGFDLEDDEGNVAFYPFSKNVQRTEEIRQDGNLGAWSLGGGMQISRNLAIGLTFDYFSGKNQYMLDFFQDDVDNNYNQYPADYDAYEVYDKITSKFRGWGIKVGSMLHLSDDLRAGLTIELPRSMIVYETYSSTDVLYFDDGSGSEADLGSGEWEYVIKYPFKFSGGVSLDMGPFTFAGSFNYRDWTQVEFDIPEGRSFTDDYQSLLDDNRFFPTSFRATFGWAAGGELRVPGTGLQLRAGYRVVPSPLVNANEILDRKYISVGIGYSIDKHAVFNLSYTQGKWNKSSSDFYTPSGTSESVKSEKFLAGITFKI
ncbi:MAG: outer membrane protein transport protein [Calditrichia bacterium]|nr:outer membrane protein transport protein [Calditrichia bacterium]